MKKLQAAVTGVVASLLLTSCAGLPRSGPVTEFSPKFEDSTNLVQAARGPVRDASPEVIVRDFLRACAAGNFDDYEKARLFLTEVARSKWQPEEIINVAAADGGPQVTVDSGRATVTATLEAQISRRGIRMTDNSGKTIEQKLELQKNSEGQWRISQLPAGVVIPQGTFQVAYARRPLFFLTPDAEEMVPDPRWFPRRGLATYLTQALLEGPCEQLEGAVKTAVPPGTRLPLNAVNISGGTATVTLSNQVLNLNDAQRQQLYRQLYLTLSRVSDISTVQLQVADTTLIRGDEPPRKNPYNQKTLAALNEDGGIVYVSSLGAKPTVLIGPHSDSNLSAPTPSPVNSNLLVARQGEDGLASFNLQDGKIVPLAKLSKITRPSLDRLGWAWVASGETGGIHAVSAQGEVVSVELAQSIRPTGIIRQLRLSLDGARAVVGFQDGSSATVVVYAVQRDETGYPQALINPVPVRIPLTQITSIAWYDQTTVAILGSVLSSGPLVWIAPLDGGVESIEPPPRANWLPGATESGNLIVADPEGVIYMRVGSTWRITQNGLFQPSLPG